MLNIRKWKKQIEHWLDEDIHEGDLSTATLIPADKRGSAWIVAKEEGVLAGLPLVALVFTSLDPEVRITFHKQDAELSQPGDVLAELHGQVQSLLAGERLALNLLQRLSGIASLTRQYVKQVEGLPVRIVDTRKTTPGLRGLEKYAVRQGGGYNHRLGLYDAVMIKDNHIKAAGGITKAITCLREHISHTVKIEVEVESLPEVEEAVAAKADIIMLDNMSLEHMRTAVQLINKQAIVEASGGVNLHTVRQIADTGVDIISVGALTHSVHNLDISMDIEERKMRSF